MNGHVFLSYSRSDEDFVLALANLLRDVGIPIWLDRWNIRPSDNWDTAIDKAIHTCGCFLVVLSSKSVKSDQVLGELQLALAEKKVIVPVRYEPCKIPRNLRRIQYADFVDHSLEESKPFCELLEALAQAAQFELPVKLPSIDDEVLLEQGSPIRVVGALLYQDRTVVTLANFSQEGTIDLSGWALLNKLKQIYSIARGIVKPGMIHIVIVERESLLFSRNDGLVELRNTQGLIVDRVQYNSEQSRQQGKATVVTFSHMKSNDVSQTGSGE